MSKLLIKTVILSILCLVSLLILISNVNGQLEIKTKTLYMKNYYSEYLGDVRHYYYEWSYYKNDKDYIIEYGIDYEPIVSKFADKFSTIYEVKYSGKKWGAGLSGWYYDNYWENRGYLQSGVESNDYRGKRYNIWTVWMWGQNLFPLLDERKKATYSDVNYWFENYLKMFSMSADFYYNLSRHFDFKLGFKFANIVNRKQIGQQQWAYLTFWGILWDNKVTLSQIGWAKYNVAGLNLGTEFKSKYMDISFSQAFLINPKAKFWSRWIDTDDIIVVYNKNKREIVEYRLYDGNIPYEREMTVFIPNTEFSIDFNFKDKFYVIGIGLWSSIFWNILLMPEFVFPGDWTWSEGTHWNIPKEDIILWGITANLGIAI